jgi:hypothetical protein
MVKSAMLVRPETPLSSPASRPRTVRRIVWAVFTLVLLSSVPIAIARMDGPPTVRTGAPAVGVVAAEPLCTLCHLGAPVNGPDGSVSFLDVPETYTPSTTYTLRVRLRDNRPPAVEPDVLHWGFSAVAVRADSGRGAGTWSVFNSAQSGDPNDSLRIQTVTLSTSQWKTRSYISHRIQSLQYGALDSVEWRFKWTSPDSNYKGAVYFFVAGNSANGDAAPNNLDHIYTSSDTTYPAPPDTNLAVPPFLANGLELAPPAPNPLRSSSRLGFVTPAAGPVELAVVDVFGRRVKTLVDGWQPAGSSSVMWDGRTDRGGRAPHGLYFLRLRTSQGVVGRRITVSR